MIKKLEMLQRFIQEEKGLHSSEYALLLGLICLTLIAAITGLVIAVDAIFKSAANIYDP